MPQSVPGLRAADEVAAAAVKSAHDRLRRRGEIGLEREKGRGAGIRDRVRPAAVLDDVDTRVSGWLLIEPHLAVNHRPALEADHAAAPTVSGGWAGAGAGAIIRAWNSLSVMPVHQVESSAKMISRFPYRRPMAAAVAKLRPPPGISAEARSVSW